MIEINNLVKKYGNHVAVDQLSLTVEPGKIYGFLGPNGAGKSTTMNIITGYLGATSGEVKINGHDIFKEPEEAKKCIGYLPELPPLYADMTVREYLDFVSELKKLEKSLRKRYVEEAMETTGITEVANRMIRNLSKGYRQRVGFAQAILGYPEIIILDEPTVGLDPKQIIEIRDLIKKLGEKHTVILSSHILTEISAVCDHVFIISKGKLVASDSTENLVNLMSGAQEIDLTIKDDARKAMTQLELIDEIEKIEVRDMTLEEEEDHRSRQETNLRIYAKKGVDVREKVFVQMAECQIPVLEMHTVTRSLEDVFLEITQEGEKK
ncbi:MAG: ABC transporter ATP-binding protein [Lachnospiraceae bacterium]|nr:ABC transporter ATP-binding protein [Agathobacter sp.]MDD6290209.1 ABC transporter ATP-binding protein [Lachnospiraceae bacterium]